ncbi:DUF1573 domain-containing protein [bacterium]|nr:MAG: DUF1573 domain-containing protein [bacterium]
MGRTDVSAHVGTTPRSGEARIAEEALVQSVGLRRAVATRQRLTATRAKLWVESKSVDVGVRVQGQPAEASFTVANNGTGPMLLRVAGDCVCLSATGPTRLEAGESGVVRARYDTTSLGGGISHRVVIRSTDPETPEAFVTMNIAVRTLVRFIVPGATTSSNPTLVRAAGQPVELFLVNDPTKPLKVRSARVDGIEGELTYEPWSGTLADPVLKEDELPRQGYRFRFVPKTLATGTTLLALSVQAEDGERHVGNVFLNKGLVVTPPAAGFPDLGTTPGRVEVILSNAPRRFRIVSIRAEGTGVSASEIEAPAIKELHRIAIVIDPAKVVKGDVRRVVVRTDDPQSPEITIPIVIPEQ